MSSSWRPRHSCPAQADSLGGIRSPSYSAYGHTADTLYEEAATIGYAVCDLFGNLFRSIGFAAVSLNGDPADSPIPWKNRLCQRVTAGGYTEALVIDDGAPPFWIRV